MKINFRDKPDAIIIDLEGNINVDSSDFVEAIGWVLAKKSKNIVCNFKNVNLVDYVGISLIAVAYKNVMNHKGQMKIFNLPHHVVKLFSVVGLDRVFDYYTTEEGALKSFTNDKRISRILKRKFRRRFKRISFPGNITFKDKNSSKIYKGKIINLSALGIFVLVNKLFPVGEILTINLNIPGVPLLGVDTKVVWIADKDIQRAERNCLGLEFHNIDSQTQEKIINFVEKHLKV
ncbi:MAG: STAS domain-containing protein [Candidatus Omnitrophica bacterium]|nr:STAS domain-containing protein [Candidatus Omnitrophota bacterium]